jgi:hypothetical protein
MPSRNGLKFSLSQSTWSKQLQETQSATLPKLHLMLKKPNELSTMEITSNSEATSANFLLL